MIRISNIDHYEFRKRSIVKKSWFTLLEMLVVIFIISLGVIVTGVKVREIYLEQRFLSESQQVLSHLAMAQDLMLIMDADIQMKIVKDSESKKIKFWLEIEKPLNPAWSRFVERKVELSSIRSVEFDRNQNEEISLQFSLGQMSKGTLTLYEGEKNDSKQADKRQTKIGLLGYPTHFTIQTEEPKEKKITNKSELLYPIEVYENLYADPSQNNQTP